MHEISIPSKGQLDELISKKESFKILGATNNIFNYCSDLEKIIESKGMTCRIYTKNRTWLTAATAYFTLGGSVLVHAGHNLLTKNPDYLIAREFINNTIEVKYNTKKK